LLTNALLVIIVFLFLCRDVFHYLPWNTLDCLPRLLRSLIALSVPVSLSYRSLNVNDLSSCHNRLFQNLSRRFREEPRGRNCCESRFGTFFYVSYSSLKLSREALFFILPPYPGNRMVELPIPLPKPHASRFCPAV